MTIRIVIMFNEINKFNYKGLYNRTFNMVDGTTIAGTVSSNVVHRRYDNEVTTHRRHHNLHHVSYGDDGMMFRRLSNKLYSISGRVFKGPRPAIKMIRSCSKYL